MKSKVEQSASPERKYLAVEKLDFDPNNPRFPAEIASGPAPELLERFVRDERLLEILVSIADQNYFEGEPLLVVKHGADRYHVIEGNRRLAALKLLTGQMEVPEGRSSIEEVCETAKNRPTEVPCLVFPHEDQILRYLGFRHITGIKSWGSLQKARYLRKLQNRFFDQLLPERQMVALAREIGSRQDYVAKMLTALTLYERAEQSNFYEVKGLSPQEIDFSVLTTAIGYKSIATYIGLEGQTDTLGTKVKDAPLKNLLSWMFVAQGNQKSVLGESRNLKRLAAVVESKSATAHLIKDNNLKTAYQLSRGPAEALHLALKRIDQELQEAWEWLPQIESPTTDDETIADSIRKRAGEMRDAIKSKRNPDDE